MKTIQEPSRDLPIICEVDVCVLGGSCTGVFAAVRAARRGLRVAIVEKSNRFGGVATNGLVCIWHNDLDDQYEKQIIAGLSLETVDRLKKRDAVLVRDKNPNARYVLNTEELTIELDGLIREHKVEPWLHTFYCRAIMGEDNNIDAVLVENKNGRGAIRAQIFIDATGDGDLAKDCEYPFSVRKDLQPPTTCAKIAGLEGIDMRSFYNEHREEFDVPKDAGWNCTIPNGGLVRLFAETHVFGANVADAREWTSAEMEGRRHIRAMMDMVRKHLPERKKDLCLLDLCSSIGTRETRRFRAAYQLTEKDLLYGKRFDDAIANGTYRVDIHYPEGGGHIFRYLDGREVSIRHDERVWSRWRPEGEETAPFYQIPYRTMVRGECPNLIMAGRMIDADPGAYGAIRVMITMNQTGEAAGEAAALICANPTPAAEVDSKKLRQALSEGGSIML
ncbi:MAG: FAD-dependent oxidoreductase [Opitutales bacterium]|nr:FAD-dependent oxidoreductase [Opitutales bacterium]